MKHSLLVLVSIVLLSLGTFSQVPLNVGVQILKAEDSRDWNAGVEALLKSPNMAVRERAALAAGRIGDKRALAILIDLIEKDDDAAEMAAFAIGEIESSEASDAIIGKINLYLDGNTVVNVELLKNLVEAAGKVAAANPKVDSTKKLGELILKVLDSGKFDKVDLMPKTTPAYYNRSLNVLALTAIMRARPDGGDVVVAKFINHDDARVRADALGTLTRLRSKQRLGDIRGLLRRDPDAVVRANAARVLGAAEDKEALPLLVDYAIDGDDLRVRVACIRSLAALKDANVVDKLIERGNQMLIPIHGDPAPLKPGEKRILKPIEVPLQKNELLEIAAAVGRLRAGTDDKEALAFLSKLNDRDKYSSSETFVAIARVSPNAVLEMEIPKAAFKDFRAAAAYGMGLSELATLKSDDMNAQAGQKLTQFIRRMTTDVAAKDQGKMMMAMPDLMRSLTALKPDNLDDILRSQMANDDVFQRAAAAELLSERPFSKENFDAVQKAFTVSIIKDKRDNDAMLAILDALAKLDKKAAVGSLLMALSSRDYLVRKKAFELLEDKELEKTSPGIPFMLKNSRDRGQDKVQPYMSAFGTRLGQVLNTDIDYRRALSRKNGSIKAVLTTEKGAFTIHFNPEEAPLTVDNWVRLARVGYFNGLAVHRVVPNFVMQDGDPRGDGNGGPGLSIRCEVNMLGYDRGAVGMALSGKDTGGSQWFVTHSPQPHLDGGYTVFGHVEEVGMKVVDEIVRGDKILKVVIIGK